MWQLKDASFDVASVVAEESSDPACKNGKRCVLKHELLISIEQKPKKKKRKKEKKKRQQLMRSLLPFVASIPSIGDLCNAE
jgi:hypothetical protein